jgi:hypothetical protein
VSQNGKKLKLAIYGLIVSIAFAAASFGLVLVEESTTSITLNNIILGPTLD